MFFFLSLLSPFYRIVFSFLLIFSNLLLFLLAAILSSHFFAAFSISTPKCKAFASNKGICHHVDCLKMGFVLLVGG